jgi:hypothetical protein
MVLIHLIVFQGITLMLYAINKDLDIIVAAATTVSEFDEFWSKIGTSVEGARRPDILETMSDEFLAKFKLPPVIISCPDISTRDDLWGQYGFVESRRNALIDRHDDMMVVYREERDLSSVPDGTTIGEYYGLTDNDPWDKRTEEEKAKDKEMQELYEKAKKAGQLSGDSFGMPEKSKTARVSDVRTSIDADGNVEIDSALAIKGLYDSNDADRIEAEAKARGETVEEKPKAKAPKKKKAKAKDAENENIIDPNGIIAIYHKVEVTNASLEDVTAAMEKEKLDLTSYANHVRDTSTGCWTASARLEHAKIIEDALVKAGLTVELYGVNDLGERLAPKGVEVVDANAQKDLPPRPWNEKANEIKSMDEDALKANKKTYRAKEFIFCGTYESADLGCVVYIAPADYFRKHNAFYPESLDIAHLLPADVKEKSPGVYQSLSRDWTSMSIELCHRGFVESGLLQLYLNNV